MRRPYRSLAGVLTTLAMLMTMAVPAMAQTDTYPTSADGDVDTTQVVNQDFNYDSDPMVLIDRDASTSTEFSFNTDARVDGVGSLYAPPIDGADSDKLIVEFGSPDQTVPLTTVGNFKRLSLDHRAVLTASAPENAHKHFYLNVYVNNDDDHEDWYDCKYDIVADSINPDEFLTLSTDDGITAMKQRYDNDTCFSFDQLSPDAEISFISFNVGDTSANDTGIGAYVDNAVLELTSGTQVFDFEPPADLQLTSICTTPDADGPDNYELYVSGSEGYRSELVDTNTGVMRVTNKGLVSTTYSAPGTTPLGDADMTLEPGDTEFLATSPDVTVIITDDGTGATDTKDQNETPCDLSPADVDLQLTSACRVEDGDGLYDVYPGNGEDDARVDLIDGKGIMRVANNGTETSTDISFNVGDQARLVHGDGIIEPGETEIYEVPANTTIKVFDDNGDLDDTKAQNTEPCEPAEVAQPAPVDQGGDNGDDRSGDDGDGDENGDDPVTTPGRVGGTDRIETAVEVSTMTYPDGAEMAFIARSDLYPDALAAGPLAAQAEGPILLTDPDELSAATEAELARLDAADGEDDLQVTVLGGPMAVSNDTYAEITADHTTDRIGGENRYETAALISGGLDTVETVYIATGENYPDAMVAGWASGLTDGAVLLAELDTVSDHTTAALEALDATTVYAVGGSAVLSDEVVTSLGAERIAGADRYDTTVEVAQLVFDQVGDPDTIYLATGADFADTLAIAPTAILGSDGILLVGDEVPATVTEALGRWQPTNVRPVGGTAAVSTSVWEAAAAAS